MSVEAHNFNGNISKWNTDLVCLRDEIHRYGLWCDFPSDGKSNGLPCYLCHAVAFKGDISTWNTAQVSSLHLLQYALMFNGDLSHWLSSVTFQRWSISWASSFNQVVDRNASKVLNYTENIFAVQELADLSPLYHIQLVYGHADSYPLVSTISNTN